MKQDAGCEIQDLVSLHLGDCLDIMPTLPSASIDMILCDLPYGTTACKWDTIIPFEPLWAQYKRLIKPNGAIVLFASQPFTSALVMSNVEMFKCQWLWRKDRASNFFQAKYVPMNAHEDICVFSTGGVNSGSKNPMRYYPQGITEINKQCRNSASTGGKLGVEHAIAMKPKSIYVQTHSGYPDRELKFKNDAGTVHPTQKPVALCEYLIRTYTNEGGTVLDNTMGSGTTAISCLNTNRRFIGIEREQKYFDIACQRINEARAQQRMFA